MILNDKDPEMFSDFSVASLKVLQKMTQQTEENSENIVKRLLSADHSKADFKKIDAHKRDVISEKIDQYLGKKNSNFEVTITIEFIENPRKSLNRL